MFAEGDRVVVVDEGRFGFTKGKVGVIELIDNGFCCVTFYSCLEPLLGWNGYRPEQLRHARPDER